MLAENIPLVLQQTRNLKRWCTPVEAPPVAANCAQGEAQMRLGPSVGAFGSFNPPPEMTSIEDWSAFLEKHHLFVFTPMILVNLYTKLHKKAGLRGFPGLDLLVIDEAHHTMQEHPFTKVVQVASEADGVPQILAVTATCGGKSDVVQTLAHLNRLSKNLCNSEVFSQVRGRASLPSDENRQICSSTWICLVRFRA